MKIQQTFILCVLALMVWGCNTPKSQNDTPKSTSEVPSKPWSVQMADAVMTRYPELVYYNGNKEPDWKYDYGLLGMAIDQLGDKDPKYSAYMKAYVDYFIDEAGNIKGYEIEEYNIDRINSAKDVLILYKRTREEKYKKALDQFVQQMETHPTTKSGGFWHKKIYPWQMWLDGIYMASPLLAQYAYEFDEPKWYDVVAHDVLLIYEKTLDPKTNLLYHAWDESREQRWCNKETGQSRHFWSRATGWYVMAIVDILDYLPLDHPDRPEMVRILNRTCEALLKVRDEETGTWFNILDMAEREGNYAEGSGTAMFTYTFAKGAQKGYLDPSYLQLANECFDAMVKTFMITDKDGMVTMTNVVSGTGLGGNPYREGDFNYYVTEEIVPNDQKGVGPFILAAVALNR